MSRGIQLNIAVLILSSTLIFAQSSKNRSHQVMRREPSYKTNNILEVFVGSAIVSGILLATDDESYEFLPKMRENNSAIRAVSPLITQLGDGKFSLALFGSLGAYHYLTGNKKAGDAAILGLESFIASGIAVQLLKHTFGRERPSNSTIEGGKWNGPFIIHKNRSIASFDAFPSGHTASIFSAAASISFIYPDGAVPYLAYGAASLVAFSRVTESTHWLSDCFVGALISYYSAKLLFDSEKGNSDIQLSLGAQNGGYLLTLSYLCL